MQENSQEQGPFVIKLGIYAAEPGELLSGLKAARLSFLKGIVARNPSQEKFLNGWQNRVE